MADRTSAAFFADLFDFYAAVKTGEIVMTPEEAQKRADVLWKRTSEYDFSAYQMECDEALITLGFAKRGVRPEWPEDGEVMLYKGKDYDV